MRIAETVLVVIALLASARAAWLGLYPERSAPIGFLANLENKDRFTQGRPELAQEAYMKNQARRNEVTTWLIVAAAAACAAAVLGIWFPT